MPLERLRKLQIKVEILSAMNKKKARRLYINQLNHLKSKK